MRTFLALVSFFTATNAMAVTYNAKNHINLGINTFYRDYSEDVVAPAKSDENGILYGVVVGYERKFPEAIMFAINLDIAIGDTKYDGSLQNMYGDYMGPWESSTANAFVDLEAKIGYTFEANERHLFTPFIGIGNSAWARGLDDAHEVYTWCYFSYGLQYDFDASGKLQYGLHIKIMPMIYGAIEVDHFVKDEMTLGNKTHFEVSTPIVYKYKSRDKNYWRFTPYYQYQSFGKSNEVLVSAWLNTYMWEPASRTHIFGLKIEYGLGY